VSPASNTVLRKVAEINPSYLQLYRDSNQGLESSVKTFTNVIQTVRPLGDDKSIVQRSIELSKNCKGILFDASKVSRYSSKMSKKPAKASGELWLIAKKIREELEPFPLILGGGLTEGNVAEVIREVKPYAVDVSSGVESSPGIKDATKIRSFIKNAKNAIG